MANPPLQDGRYPHVHGDGVCLRRNWGGEYQHAAILMVIAVNEGGCHEVLSAAERMEADTGGWISFFQWFSGRGLNGAKLALRDKCLRKPETAGEVFPDAKNQRRTVRFCRNACPAVPRPKVKRMAQILQAIHAQESKKAAGEKAEAVEAEIQPMKRNAAVQNVENRVGGTLTPPVVCPIIMSADRYGCR